MPSWSCSTVIILELLASLNAHKCMKIFFCYNRCYTDMQLLLERSLPSWNSLPVNSQTCLLSDCRIVKMYSYLNCTHDVPSFVLCFYVPVCTLLVLFCSSVFLMRQLFVILNRHNDNDDDDINVFQYSHVHWSFTMLYQL